MSTFPPMKFSKLEVPLAFCSSIMRPRDSHFLWENTNPFRE
jgi:hypothetical protein